VRRGIQLYVPGDARRLGSEGQGSREVDGVVAAQPEFMGELAGPTGQDFVDADHEQLRINGLEVLDRPAVTRRRETTTTPGGRERSTSLWVDEKARRGGEGSIPELRCEL
jgi:hypothetical protein